MGLKGTIKAAVASAFRAVGDLAESATYRRVASTYNTGTGAVTSTNTDYTLAKAVFVRYDSLMVDKVMILATDIKCLVQTSELTVTPNIATDRVIRSDGRTYSIVRFEVDPSGSLYTLQLRSPN